MEDLKGAVKIEVHERDGAPVLVVKDACLNVEFHHDLPSNFYTLEPVKQNYWINKELKIIARKIKASLKSRSYQ